MGLPGLSLFSKYKEIVFEPGTIKVRAFGTTTLLTCWGRT